MPRVTRASKRSEGDPPVPVASTSAAALQHQAKNPRKGKQGVSSDESDDSDSGASEASVTTSVGSTPDASGALRRKYNRLIDDCRKLEKKEGFSTDIQQVMTNNIKSASSLFQKLSHPQAMAAAVAVERRPQPITSSNVGVGIPVQGTPGDLYMAFLHTKMISEVLKSKTSSIGVSQSGFKLDEFLATLKRKCVTEDSPAYNVEIASKALSMELAAASKTLPPLTAVVGSFDRDAISVPKEKKPRAPIVRKRFEDVEKTQEEVNVVNYSKTDGPQNLALHLNRALKQYARTHSKPITLYEFVLDPGSLNKTIESIFYVAFLVHDGVAALHKPAASPLDDFAIEVKPEKKTEEEEKNNKISTRRNTRNQYILSFSAKMYRELCAKAQGEPIIPPYSPIEDTTDK